MINLCRGSISPRLSNNVLAKPNRDIDIQVMLSNRDAVRTATDIHSTPLPSKEQTIKIFGDVK